MSKFTNDSMESVDFNVKDGFKTETAADYIPNGKPSQIKLSNRQQQMLNAIVKGKRYKEIAFQYGISENTVAFHISKLKEQLNCVSSREIISAAIYHGLVAIGEK